jgi:hypothetical protein
MTSMRNGVTLAAIIVPALASVATTLHRLESGEDVDGRTLVVVLVAAYLKRPAGGTCRWTFPCNRTHAAGFGTRTF